MVSKICKCQNGSRLRDKACPREPTSINSDEGLSAKQSYHILPSWLVGLLPCMLFTHPQEKKFST
jgi:hypothetical protein